MGKPCGPHEDYVEHAVMGDSLVRTLAMLISGIQEMARATASAIEQRKKAGAATDMMENVAKGFDYMLGKVDKVNSQGRTHKYPQTLHDLILSEKVFLKKK